MMHIKIKPTGIAVLCFAPTLLLSSCFVPWFPLDPHREAVELLQNGEITHDTLIDMIGPPDFILDEVSYVWVASKTDLYFTAGNNLAGPVSDRDFILAVDFDPQGEIISHEVYPDSGTHNICLANGICFTPGTLNVPLAPTAWDMKAKKFESDRTGCIVYVYRDAQGAYAPNDDYVHINLVTKPSYQSDIKMTDLSNLSVASVPGGYSYWIISAPVSVQLRAVYDYPRSYKFGIDNKADQKRPRDKITFDCDVNDIKYVRLFVPEHSEAPSELVLVTAEQAQTVIMDLGLLLKLGYMKVFTMKEPGNNGATDSQN